MDTDQGRCAVRREIAGLTAAALLQMITGCSVVTEERILSFDPAPDGVLRVDCINGSVTVQEGDTDAILVRAVVCAPTRRGLERIVIGYSEGTGLTVNRTGGLSSGGASLDITIPRGMSIGPISTSNGDIDIEGCAGAADLSTSNGSITLSGFSGTVSSRSSNGSIGVSGGGAVLIRLETSNGDIHAEASGFEPATRLETTNASISLAVAPVDATFEMETSNGDVTVTGTGFTEVDEDGTEGFARMGSGTMAVRLSTSNGSVDLRSL
jgi:hypothetical protein